MKPPDNRRARARNVGVMNSLITIVVYLAVAGALFEEDQLQERETLGAVIDALERATDALRTLQKQTKAEVSEPPGTESDVKRHTVAKRGQRKEASRDHQQTNYSAEHTTAAEARAEGTYRGCDLWPPALGGLVLLADEPKTPKEAAYWPHMQTCLRANASFVPHFTVERADVLNESGTKEERLAR
eukprot:1342013-Prymnesium_polylepis.1